MLLKQANGAVKDPFAGPAQHCVSAPFVVVVAVSFFFPKHSLTHIVKYIILAF